MAAGDLTTLAKAREWVGSAASDDHLVSRLITAASAWIAGYIDRDLPLAVRGEVRDGTGSSTLLLRHSPVVSVASLYVDGSRIQPRPAFGQPGFVVSEGKYLVLSRCGVFARDVQNVQIVYTAGYDPIPEDLQQDVLEIVAERYRYKDRTGHKAIIVEGQNIVFKDEDVPRFVKSNLDAGGWRRVVPL